MKSVLLGLVLAASCAFATTVTFDTSVGSTFSCIGYSGGGACSTPTATSIRVDDLILTYTPNSGFVNAPPATSIGAGDIVASCFAQATCLTAANFTGATFTLDIKETGAVTGDAIFTASLSGSQNINSGIIRILLTPASRTLVNGATSVTFTPDQPVLGYPINPVSDNRATSLQVIVDSTTRDTVPEPSSMALLASGLIGLGIFARKKK